MEINLRIQLIGPLVW